MPTDLCQFNYGAGSLEIYAATGNIMFISLSANN